MKKPISILINARLQSTRIPNKLLRPFSGSTLMEVALQKLNAMDFVTHRYLGVAEEPLKALGSKYANVEVLEREMAAVNPGYGDHRKIYAHYARIESDYILWLNPCHPLLSIETVQRAVETFQQTDCNSYTAVVKTREWLFDAEGNPVTHVSASTLSTGVSQQFYKASHSFHIINKAFFLKDYQYWTLTKDDPHLIEIPESENFDCDTPVQFETAEAVYKARRSGPA